MFLQRHDWLSLLGLWFVVVALSAATYTLSLVIGFPLALLAVWGLAIIGGTLIERWRSL